MAHIARCLELMRALDLPFNLRTAYNLLANKDHLKNTLDTVPEHPRAKELLPLVQHFETFYLNLKSEGQSEGEGYSQLAQLEPIVCVNGLAGSN
jgi:hypothetical protein